MLSAEELKQISDIMESHLKPIETKLDKVDERLDKIEERLDIIDESLEETRGTTIEVSKWIETYFGHKYPYPMGINDEED